MVGGSTARDEKDVRRGRLRRRLGSMFDEDASARRDAGGWMDGSSSEDAACFETYFRDDGVEFVDDVVDALPGFGEEVAALVGGEARGTATRSSESEESEEMTLAIRAHPMYARLVEAYYECRKIGADAETADALEREKSAMVYSVQATKEDSTSASSTFGSSNALDLDDFMRECTHELESYVKELHSAYESAKECCEHFEARARNVHEEVVRRERAAAAAGERRAPATVDEHADASDDFDKILSSASERRDHEERLRQDLKRKYAKNILTLKSEFMRKRKKGKLPDASTEVLKKWWSENIVWPYPSDEAKSELIAKTNLDATQVNNWFINFRKRHWIKLFGKGQQPRNEDESAKALARAFGGSLEKAIEYARSL